MLPEGEDLNEWVAVNTVDFFNQINMLYGTITEFCTEQSCPVMSAGPKYEVGGVGWGSCTNHILSSTTGLMEIRSRSLSSVQLPSILTSS